MMANRLNPDYLLLGQLLRPHGIRGEMRMKVLTEYPERLIQGNVTIYISTDMDDTEPKPIQLKSARFHKDYLLVTLDGVDRNQAELLRQYYVMIDIEHAVPLEEGEYYAYEIIGLRVQLESGEELGVIKDIIETGANDVYIVQSRKYGEILLPAHDETIIEIDFDNEVVTMQLPDGLLPES